MGPISLETELSPAMEFVVLALEELLVWVFTSVSVAVVELAGLNQSQAASRLIWRWTTGSRRRPFPLGAQKLRAVWSVRGLRRYLEGSR
jgi:hypothetical protein